MIADTSRRAYRAIRPFLSGKRKAVYELFTQHENGATRQEIARWYKLKECSVCGRVNELLAPEFAETKKTNIQTKILKF
ncbi:hypothetical protein CPIN18021_0328 [Campylobacter pinnipediorum subsp. caledonicus]|uniref:Uncharacterized protein n=1 Tax=Campylobacter pinnipediorum subsp. caledonicus TaxID=1874362 RepID=A0A1S6U675_9BACT|nr:hypothetical protein [Campylobacter pinnipediorum]AQW87175.1 hypothetical protein CPIN18021_0328 [Campylobacter pinnipediorum subsp. caledonicus]